MVKEDIEYQKREGMNDTHKPSVITRALWIIRNRPTHFLPTLRSYALFSWTNFLRSFLVLPGVECGTNVRLQKLRCLSAEAPTATIWLDDNSVIYEHARLEAYGDGAIVLGSESIVGETRIISRYKITIGKRFLSSWNVLIQDFDPHPTSQSERALQVSEMVAAFKPGAPLKKDSERQVSAGWPLGSTPFPGAEIVLGDDVWVGANTTILKGALIGSGSIVASGAVVVAGTYPERSLLVGNPATVIKQLPT
jgi:acetyltransferase-like isoleucine patch superfamily enzyme